jgi:replicative DNA helicase
MYGRTCYQVRFDDGSCIVADADHQWRAAHGAESTPEVVTTQQLVDRGARTTGAGGATWTIPLAGALALPERELPLDPYLLGVRLGDEFPVPSPDHRQECHLVAAGRTAAAGATGGTRDATHPAGGGPTPALSLPPGVFDGGSLPSAYLRSSIRQRDALLRGVMDSDAGVTHDDGTVEICISDRAVLVDVRELVCSLGRKAGPIRDGDAEGLGGERRGWSFVLWPGQTHRSIVAIEPCPSVPVRCITVDSPEHLYLAGDSMIPTHNTAMALGMAAHAAMEAQVPVLFFSLEMSHSEVTQRLLCSEARVDSTRVRNGKLLESDWPKISHAIGRLGEAPLYIDDNPNLTVMEIRAKARRLRSRLGNLGLIVVDYLQLMSGRHSAENRQVEVSEISRGLKILARELEVPVVALSQLSRGLEMRSDKRPVLADLRESGSLEQDADVVMFLYRDEVYNSESADRGTAEIIISKHRNGPTGVTHLAFLDHYTRFANMARV